MVGEKNQCGDVVNGVQVTAGSGPEPSLAWCGSAPAWHRVRSRGLLQGAGKACERRRVSTEVKGQRLLVHRLAQLKTSASAPCLRSNPRTSTSTSGALRPAAAAGPRGLDPMHTHASETHPRRARPKAVVVKPTEGQGDGGTSGSTLPPIFGSKITPQTQQPLDQAAPPPRSSGDLGRSKQSQSQSQSGTRTCVPSAVTPRPNRKLLRRQEVGGQRSGGGGGVRLVCSSVSVLNVARRGESVTPRRVSGCWTRRPDTGPPPPAVSPAGPPPPPAVSPAGPLPAAGSSKASAAPERHLQGPGNPGNPGNHGNAGDPGGSDSGRATSGQVESSHGDPCRTRAQVQLCSLDSAIASDSQSSAASSSEDEEEEEEEEEEYYTDQRIGEWVVRVNASLFSPSDSAISCDSRLEEEDVDTIKIIYDQD